MCRSAARRRAGCAAPRTSSRSASTASHTIRFTLSADGDFSWEEVECLGACVNAPMVLIGKDTYEDLTPESFEKVLDGFAKGKPVKPGPQIDRQFSAPSGGATTLTDPAIYASQPDARAARRDRRRCQAPRRGGERHRSAGAEAAGGRCEPQAQTETELIGERTRNAR